MSAPIIAVETTPPTAADIAPSTVAQQRFALFLLTLVLGLNMADRNILLIVLEPVKTEFGLTDSQVGLLSGFTFGLTYAAASIPWGLLVDRVNRSRLLASVLFVWSGATALAATAQGFVSLLFTRLLVGFSEAGGSPTSLSLIADYFTPRHRPAAISVYNMGTPLGAFTALALGGLIVAHWGWRAGFLLAGIPGLVMTLVVLVILRDPRKRAARPARGGLTDVSASLLGAVAAIVGNRSLALLTGAVTLMTIASSGTVNWVVPFLMRQHHLPVQQAGLAMAVSYGLGAFGLAAAGAFAHRIRDKDPRYSLYFAMGVAFVAVAGTTLFLLGESFILSMSGLILVGALGYTYVGPAYAIVLNIAPERARGSVLAILQILSNLVGYGVGTLLVGLFSDLYGGPSSLRWAVLSLMPLYVLALLLFFFVSFHVRADMAAAAERSNP